MMTSDEIEYLAILVQAAHCAREDIPEGPLISKPFKPRARPRTALISKAAQRAISDREWAEAE